MLHLHARRCVFGAVEAELIKAKDSDVRWSGSRFFFVVMLLWYLY